MERSQSIHADESELRRQVRAEAGASARGERFRARRFGVRGLVRALRKEAACCRGWGGSRGRRVCDWRGRSLVTKLLLGHAPVLEALLPRAGIGRERPRFVHADEAELRRQVRSQAGAWERGASAPTRKGWQPGRRGPRQPRWGWRGFFDAPRVGAPASRQTWADGWNAVGVRAGRHPARRRAASFPRGVPKLKFRHSRVIFASPKKFSSLNVIHLNAKNLSCRPRCDVQRIWRS